MIKPTHYLQVQVLLALSRWANCSELSTLYQSEDNLSKPKKNYWNLLDNSMNVIWHAWQIELVSASQRWSHPTSGARASTYRSYHGRYIWLLGIVSDKWNKNEDISQIRLALSYYYTQINKKKTSISTNLGSGKLFEIMSSIYTNIYNKFNKFLSIIYLNVSRF